MANTPTRRDLIGTLSRGAAFLGLSGTAGYLVQKAQGQIVWQVDAVKCVNSRIGEAATEACNLCTTSCVVTQSAVRAVNDFGNCGRCNICPAYFNIKSAVDPVNGLPSEKRCPRDAITRKPIGLADPQDPANNYYEYVIDEAKCDGCGKCVMGCKEPMGLGSVRLMVRHSLCVDCNRCAISISCPKDAIERKALSQALSLEKAEHADK